MDINKYFREEILIKSIVELQLEDLIEYAEKFVNEYLLGVGKRKQIKTHQIRRFYDAIKSIEVSVRKNGFRPQDKAKLLMLIPQLANAMGKQRDLRELKDVCTALIPKVNDGEDFTKFVNFFQSIVAFHKAYAKE